MPADLLWFTHAISDLIDAHVGVAGIPGVADFAAE
jgi:hypothetical protein